MCLGSQGSPLHSGGGGCMGVERPLNHTASSIWAGEAGGASPQGGGETVTLWERPLPPLSPCRAAPYSRRSTLEKIDCLFLPDCSGVTGRRAGGGGRGRAAAFSSGWIFLPLWTREAAPGVIAVRARACQGLALRWAQEAGRAALFLPECGEG